MNVEFRINTQKYANRERTHIVWANKCICICIMYSKRCSMARVLISYLPNVEIRTSKYDSIKFQRQDKECFGSLLENKVKINVKLLFVWIGKLERSSEEERGVWF